MLHRVFDKDLSAWLYPQNELVNRASPFFSVAHFFLSSDKMKLDSLLPCVWPPFSLSV